MQDKDLKSKTISGLIFKTIERIGLQGVSLVISIVLARLLLPEDYGNVSLIMVLLTLLDVIVNYGLGSSLIQKKDPDDLDYSTCFWASLVLTVFLYAVLFFTAPLIARFYKNEALSVMIQALGIRLIWSGVNSVQNAYVAKNFLFKRSMIASIIATVVSGTIGIIAAYLGYGEWALIIQSLLSVALTVLVLAFLLKLRIKFEFSFERFKLIFGFGWKLMIMGFLNSLYDEIRSLLIAKKYSTADLAYYEKGRDFPKLISNNVNSIIDGVIFSTMSAVQDDQKRLVSVLSRSIQISIYVLTPMLIGLAAISDNLIIVLYTEKWIEAALYLKIFCISFLMMPVITLNLNLLKSVGKSGLALKIDIIKKIVGVTLIIVSIPLGVKWVAISTIAVNFISTVIHMITARIFFDYSIMLQVKDIVIQAFPGLLMGIGVLAVGRISLTPILMMLVQILVGCILFTLISVLLKNESFRYLISLLGLRKKHEI